MRTFAVPVDIFNNIFKSQIDHRLRLKVSRLQTGRNFRIPQRVRLRTPRQADKSALVQASNYRRPSGRIRKEKCRYIAPPHAEKVLSVSSRFDERWLDPTGSQPLLLLSRNSRLTKNITCSVIL